MRQQSTESTGLMLEIVKGWYSLGWYEGNVWKEAVCFLVFSYECCIITTWIACIVSFEGECGRNLKLVWLKKRVPPLPTSNGWFSFSPLEFSRVSPIFRQSQLLALIMEKIRVSRKCPFIHLLLRFLARYIMCTLFLWSTWRPSASFQRW